MAKKQPVGQMITAALALVESVQEQWKERSHALALIHTLCEEGTATDGGDHKQWFLEQIGKVAASNLGLTLHGGGEEGIAP